MDSLRTGNERVVVLGGRGMLGTDLTAALREGGYEAAAHDLPEFDIRRVDDLEVALEGADGVVNCAAYTNVDGAEAEPELARAVNADAVGVLGRLAAARGLYVVHVSTDFVFDGALDRAYAETDEARPLSVYGATKLAGERVLAETGCGHAVVRVEWTYGRAGRNFVTKCLERARDCDEMRMVDDQIGSPTWTRDAALALIELLEARRTGLYHYAASGWATRLEVAQFILEQSGLQRRLTACRTADFPAAAQRPLNSRFDCARVDAVLKRPRPCWQDSLRTFLAQGQ